MLRRQDNELEQLQAKIEELAKEVDELKLQIKLNKSEKSNHSQLASDYKLGNKIGKRLGNLTVNSESIGDKFSRKQIYKIFSNLVSSQINIPNSFSLSKSQQHHQQAQNFKNILYKL